MMRMRNISAVKHLIVLTSFHRPSFVAGAAVADSDQQQRAIVNTILSLSASTLCAFWMSSYLSKNKRFRPVDIQNATLAGW